MRLDLLLLFASFGLIECAPLVMVVNEEQLRNPMGGPKMIWSISDLISSTSWLPVEINVPDTISSISSGISGVIQTIPIFNRFTSAPVKPRPLKYVMVPFYGSVPEQEQHVSAASAYSPFTGYGFPSYP